jgi:hypothetical protein
LRNTSEIVCTQFTQPTKDYQKIKCILGSRVINGPCFRACGLACAEDCLRYFDKVCPGCPCLQKGGLNHDG